MNRRRKVLHRIIAGGLACLMAFTMLPSLPGMMANQVEASNVVYQPLSISSSSYNADCFLDSGESKYSLDSCEALTTVGSGSQNAFYTASYNSTGGFPASGVITDESVSGLTWQLAGYKTSNTIRIAPGNSANINFTTVGVYQKLYFLVIAGGVGVGSNASMKVDVVYSDGSSSIQTFSVVDWYDSTNSATAKYRRINLSSINGSITGGPYLTRCEMAINTTKLIDHISVSNNSGAVFLSVFGITGKTADIAAPTGLNLTGCTALNAKWNAVSGATSYRIDVARDTNFKDIVGDYNNKAVSTNSCQIKGLELNRTYYARVRAVDASGGQSISSGIVNVKSAYNWNYAVSPQNKLTINCSVDGCDYDKSSPMTVELKAKDAVFDRKTHGATIGGSSQSLIKQMTGYSVGAISYYKVATQGATTGGTLLTGKKSVPRDVGHYYAKVEVTNGTNTYTLLQPYSIVREKYNYSMDNLNNKSNEESQAVKKVSGDYPDNANASSDLKVVLTEASDTITLYKIADMKWNANNNDYDDLEWVPEVQTWIEHSMTDVDTDYLKSVYESPNSLGDASTSVWRSFYKDMFVSDNNITNTLAPYNSYSDVAKTGTDEDNAYTLFEDLPFGTYAIMASNGGKKYAPLVINIVPSRNGPQSAYYVKLLFVAYLKDAEASVNKKINGQDISDTIAIGEETSFTVDYEIPTLPKDRVTEKASGQAQNVYPYTLELQDEMSPAFSLLDENASGYTDDLVITYTGTKGGVTVTEEFTVDAGGYSYYVYTLDTSKTAFPADGMSGGKKVYYDDSQLDSLQGTYYYSKNTTDLPYSIVVTPPTDPATDNTTIRIKFNVSALKGWMAANNVTNISDVHLTYKTRVTEYAKAASDDNTNTATILLEKNAAGSNTGTCEPDTVRGYTYGLQVVKVDGATEGTDTVKYLEGAKFKLFKETETFVKNAEGVWEWKGDMQGSASYAGPMKDAVAYTIEDFKSDKKYYVHEYTVEADTETLDSWDATDTSQHIVLDKDTEVIRIFEECVLPTSQFDAEGNFTSTNTEDGIIVAGLDTGNYIMVETKAPAMYNDLAEDIFFSIKGISDEDSMTIYNGSRICFKEMDDNLNMTGILSLRVLNYRGLTLPSTGGMGTLLFIILGIALMGGAIAFVIVRNRRNNNQQTQ